MINAYLLEQRNKAEQEQQTVLANREAKAQSHKRKTDRLADQHYKRVTSFAKEMLVWPTEIEVHKIQNPAYISEVKPAGVVPPLPSVIHHGHSKSIEVSSSRRGAAGAQSLRLQPPMKFGSFQTGTERLAQSILESQALDPSPSKRTMVGSDVAVMNLRPEDQSRMLGRPGHLRVKAQSSIQQQLDRMSMERPQVLPEDRKLQRMYKRNTVEQSLQRSPIDQIKSATSSIRKQQIQENLLTGRNTQLEGGAMSARRERTMDLEKNRNITLETIMRRNNSISTVKKHAIPYAHMHKKTYFNALEKILQSPKHLRAESVDGSFMTIGDSATRAFDDVFKKPPSRLGDQQPRRNLTTRKQKSPMETIKVVEANAIKVNDSERGSDEDQSQEGEKKKVEASWFDSFIDRQNISLDDQRAPDASRTQLEKDEEFLMKQSQQVGSFHVVKPTDKIVKNKKLLNDPSLLRLEERTRTSQTIMQNEESTTTAVGKASVLNQVLRQCNFRKSPVQKRNLQPAIIKQKAMNMMRGEIRDYANLSTVTQEISQPNSQTQQIPRSYLSKAQRNATIDLARVSQETASAFDSQYNSILRDSNLPLKQSRKTSAVNKRSLNNNSAIKMSAAAPIGTKSPQIDSALDSIGDIVLGAGESRASFQ